MSKGERGKNQKLNFTTAIRCNLANSGSWAIYSGATEHTLTKGLVKSWDFSETEKSSLFLSNHFVLSQKRHTCEQKYLQHFLKSRTSMCFHSKCSITMSVWTLKAYSWKQSCLNLWWSLLGTKCRWTRWACIISFSSKLNIKMQE